MDLTKPFVVGETYQRADGKTVTCIALSEDLKGYECAQFDDYEETHARTADKYKNEEDVLDYIKRFGGDDPKASGFRYNRPNDRGRCTGSAFDFSDPFNVIPHRQTYVTVEQLDWLMKSFKDIL